MFKGKYVLISIEELREKISSYLCVDFDFKMSGGKGTNFIIEIASLNWDTDKRNVVLQKIIGKQSHLMDDLTFDGDGFNIVLDMGESGYMLKNILDIKENVMFDDEVLFSNEDEDIYIFYTDNKC